MDPTGKAKALFLPTGTAREGEVEGGVCTVEEDVGGGAWLGAVEPA